jgi:hypothetical protein
VIDLSAIYTTACVVEASAELRCQDHPDWWADADGTNLPDLIEAAGEHVRWEHRVHVEGCMCRDRVLDQRCIPTVVTR